MNHKSEITFVNAKLWILLNITNNCSWVRKKSHTAQDKYPIEMFICKETRCFSSLGRQGVLNQSKKRFL